MNIVKNEPFKMGLQGLYKISVIDDKTGNIIWSQPDWNKNLILNQGMDHIADDYLANMTLYGISGNGTRFNSLVSGESSGSVTTGTFTLYRPYGESTNGITHLTQSYSGYAGGLLAIGDIIKFADGTEIMISSGITDLTAVVTANSSQTVGIQSFTLWKTSQTSLQNEISRSGEGPSGTPYDTYYVVGPSNCGTTTTGNVVSYLRTYDFSAEPTLRSYTEVGVGWDTDNSPINSTFSRILLPTAVDIDVGQRLRLAYQLNVTFTPVSASGVVNPSISGWTNTNMSQSIQNISWVSSISSTTGDSSTSWAALEPPSQGSLNCVFWGSSNSQSLVPLGDTPPNRNALGTAEISDSGTAITPYINSDYILYKYASWSTNVLNRQNLRSFGFGPDQNVSPNYNPYDSNGQAFTILFEQSQSKSNTQTLSLTFKWQWSRTLA